MLGLRRIAAALFAAAGLIAASILPTAPAHAAGKILITHAKALAGNVTPGDSAGYPVTISIPGKFQLASNLFVPANKIGIQVTSPFVTIDLNGFLMQGSNVAWYGITGGQHGLVIENGFITSFKFDGINGSGNRWLVEKVQVTTNGRDGIALFGFIHHVRGNTVIGNIKRGIVCGGSCVISENIVTSNGGDGVTSRDATMVGNFIGSNSGRGIQGGIQGGPTGAYAGIGLGHNVVIANGSGNVGDQVNNTLPLHPNICVGVSC